MSIVLQLLQLLHRYMVSTELYGYKHYRLYRLYKLYKICGTMTLCTLDLYESTAATGSTVLQCYIIYKHTELLLL